MHMTTAHSFYRDLGHGLIARWSSATDTDNLAQLVGMVFREKADEPENAYLVSAVHRVMREGNPLMGPHDYALIEDTHKTGNPIVACACLWRQVWAYEGIDFTIGRPEFVATDPEYRNRGLIRTLFEMIHTRSAQEGHPVTAITGIPYFYRQFGYEYALDLGGKHVVYTSQIPVAKADEPEPYALREATVEDIPLIQALYNRRSAESIVWTKVPDYYWRYELEAWKSSSEQDRQLTIQIINNTTGQAQGYLFTPTQRRERDLSVWGLAVVAGVNVQAVLPSILRALQAYGEQMPITKPDVAALSMISFYLGRNHPLYAILGGLAPFSEAPYAWYVRVPNVPAFLHLIAPALEKRLAASDLAGYTGELKLDFYKGGLRMNFVDGKLTEAEDWRVPAFEGNAGAGFPPLVFLQLLFGRRSIAELRHAFPDVWVNDDCGYVLTTLFPSRPSFTLPL